MQTNTPEPMPQTKKDWLIFMNGYRDPKTWAEYRADAETYADAWETFEGGGGGSGARECGSRKEGGTYATCPLSRHGKPLEHFVICQPVPIVADDYNLANVGVKLVDIEEPCLVCNGAAPKRKSVKARYLEVCEACQGSGTETVTHVFDIVGQEYYPNVADFLEESRRMGVSRRLELEDARQYARLSDRSKLMLLHHRAVINNGGERLVKTGQTELIRLYRASCPKGLHELAGQTKKGAWLPTGQSTLKPGCSALYWHMIEKGEELGEGGGFVERKLVSGSYRGYALPDGYTPEYGLGIFAVFPLVKIQVVDPDGSYEDRVSRAGNARLDVEAVEC
jgi:hypothetical protein